MKKILWVLLCLAGTVAAWSAETFSQKVGLSVDSSRKSLVEEMLLKSIIAKGEGLQGIYLFWDDPRELKEKNIDKLNARVRLMVAESNAVYYIRLYILSEKDQSPLAPDVAVPGTEFVQRLEGTLDTLTGQLRKSFPPLEKRQMKEIVVETRTLSQFESPSPRWNVGGGMSLNSTDYDLDMLFYEFGNTDGDYVYEDVTAAKPVILAEAQYNYRNTFFFATFDLETALTRRDWGIGTTLGLGKGILGSVVVLGVMLHARYHWIDLPFDGIFNTYSSGFPDTPFGPYSLQYWYVGPGLFIRLNITRKYSLEYRQYTGAFGNMAAYGQGVPPLSQEGIFIQNEGPGDQNLRLHFGLNSRMRLYLDYRWGKNKLDLYNNTNRIIEVFSNGDRLELSRLSLSKINIGIGMLYEL